MADCKGIRDTKTGVVYSLADEEARGDISRLEKSVGSMRTQADSYSRTETDTLLKGKLDISAGTENAGKAVMVMPDGSIGYAAAGTDPAVSSQVEENRKDIASVQADVKALDGVSYTKAESDALLEGKLDSKTSAGERGEVPRGWRGRNAVVYGPRSRQNAAVEGRGEHLRDRNP